MSSTLPRPSEARFGASRPPTAFAVLPKVFAPSSPKTAASGAWPAPRPSRTIIVTRRPMFPPVLSDQHSGYCGTHQVCERAGEDGPDAVLGNFGAAVGRDAAEAAEQNRQGTEVCEAGEGEGYYGRGFLREVPDVRGEVRKSDELVQDQLLAEKATGPDRLFPRNPDQEHEGGEDVAEYELKREVRQADEPSQRAQDQVQQRDERDKGDQHGPDV